ncbi:MAG: hypothetical protein R8G66_15435 [Cytophagales bacterium]|nr:hypothetical protein [Cytophagales bacterium]
MDSIYYPNTTYWVIAVAVITAIATIFLYRQARSSLRAQWTVGISFTVMILIVHWIFGGQHMIPPTISGGAFYLIILIGASVGVGLFYVTSNKIFEALSQEHLQIVQGLRVFVGAGFLMEGVVGVIPAWFSILDGYFHITSGFLALVAAIAFIKKHRSARTLLWSANIIGLLDIFTIITSICFLVWEDLGPFHNMNYVVFIAGPVLLWLHFVSIRKLLRS